MISEAPVFDDARHGASDASGNEILTPTFATLMHELGHSLKMAAGGYMPMESGQDPENEGAFQTFLPGSAAAFRGGEQNPNKLEEKVNVTGVENQVRQEAGLKSREFYATPQEARLEQARQVYYGKWAALKTLDRDVPFYLEDVFNAVQTGRADDDRTIAKAKTPDEIEAKIDPVRAKLDWGAPELIVEKQTAIREVAQRAPRVG